MSCAAPPSRPLPRRPLGPVLRIRRPRDVRRPEPQPVVPKVDLGELQRLIDLFA
jgi:hypothetical protein